MALDYFAFHIETQALAQVLDALDYFQLLKLEAGATPGEIRAAFHRESRSFHPDRVFHLEDEELKANVHRIYKRITEAYVVLRDDEKRAKYLADVTGPDREKRLRYDELAEQEQKKAKDELSGTTPMGKKTFALALADLAANRLDGAERNLKLAVAYEPANLRFKEKLDEVLRLRKAAAGK